MALRPNRIVLKSMSGRYDEGHANRPIYPGMLCQKVEGGGYQPHSIYGGDGSVIVAIEDALRAGTKNTVFPTGNDGCPLWLPVKGDMMLMLLQNGANAPDGCDLISAGDGTLVPDTYGPLLETQAAASDTTTYVTNTNAETSFSNSTVTLAAGSDTASGNIIGVNHTVNISGEVTLLGKHAADTQVIKVYVGGVVLTFPTVALNVGDKWGFSLDIVFTAIGASGKMQGTGTYWYGDPTNPTVATLTLAPTAIDTTAAIPIKVTATASATDPANKVQLTNFRAAIDRSFGNAVQFRAEEAIDNSAGVGTSPFNKAAFIKVTVK